MINQTLLFFISVTLILSPCYSALAPTYDVQNLVNQNNNQQLTFSNQFATNQLLASTSTQLLRQQIINSVNTKINDYLQMIGFPTPPSLTASQTAIQNSFASPIYTMPVLNQPAVQSTFISTPKAQQPTIQQPAAQSTTQQPTVQPIIRQPTIISNSILSSTIEPTSSQQPKIQNTVEQPIVNALPTQQISAIKPVNISQESINLEIGQTKIINSTQNNNNNNLNVNNNNNNNNNSSNKSNDNENGFNNPLVPKQTRTEVQTLTLEDITGP